MIKKLISLLILTSFVFSFVAGSENDISLSGESTESLIKSSLKVSSSFSVDTGCTDCDSDECDHKDTHCAHHHCTGLHNIAFYHRNVALFTPSHFNNKTLWYLNNHYKTPFLDQALRPPTHS